MQKSLFLCFSLLMLLFQTAISQWYYNIPSGLVSPVDGATGVSIFPQFFCHKYVWQNQDLQWYGDTGVVIKPVSYQFNIVDDTNPANRTWGAHSIGVLNPTDTFSSMVHRDLFTGKFVSNDTIFQYSKSYFWSVTETCTLSTPQGKQEIIYLSSWWKFTTMDSVTTSIATKPIQLRSNGFPTTDRKCYDLLGRRIMSSALPYIYIQKQNMAIVERKQR